MLVQLRNRIPNTAARRGQRVSEAEVVLKLEGDCDVYKPDGEPLCILRRGGVPPAVREQAYPTLHELRLFKSDNRAAYAGAKRMTSVFQDGTRSKAHHTRDENGKVFSIATAIVGYFDRQGGWFPFCRETAYVGKEPEKWAQVMPQVDAVARLFEVTLPERYARQMAMVARTPHDFVIGGTPFTTLTVNNNIAGTIHQDKGDYKDGFGIISVHRLGTYQGGWLVFPEYGVGADLRDGDVIFFNSHDWHGVTPFHDEVEGWERISVVYYFREKMVNCLPARQELERARKRYGDLSQEG